jgi:hypothetical protein
MNLQSILLKFLWITGELTLLFILISTLTGLLLQYLTSDKIYLWISGKGILGNILGAGIGALTPFCACSTIPLASGFLKAGIPF